MLDTAAKLRAKKKTAAWIGTLMADIGVVSAR